MSACGNWQTTQCAEEAEQREAVADLAFAFFASSARLH
jgi:hypothetical protein